MSRLWKNKLHFADFVVSKTCTKLKVRFNGKEVYLTDAKKVEKTLVFKKVGLRVL